MVMLGSPPSSSVSTNSTYEVVFIVATVETMYFRIWTGGDIVVEAVPFMEPQLLVAMRLFVDFVLRLGLLYLA